MNGPPPPLVQELAALGYALTHALYTEAKELLVKEGLSPRKAHLLGLLAKGVDLPSQLAEPSRSTPPRSPTSSPPWRRRAW